MTSSNFLKWQALPDPPPRRFDTRYGRRHAGLRPHRGAVSRHGLLGCVQRARRLARTPKTRRRKRSCVCYRSLPSVPRVKTSFSTWRSAWPLTSGRGLQAPRAAPPPTDARGTWAGPLWDSRPELGDGSPRPRGPRPWAALPHDYRVPTGAARRDGLPLSGRSPTVTGRPLGTVKAMVHRGRTAFRLRLPPSAPGTSERLMDCGYFCQRINQLHRRRAAGTWMVAELQRHTASVPAAPPNCAQLSEVRGALPVWGSAGAGGAGRASPSASWRRPSWNACRAPPVPWPKSWTDVLQRLDDALGRVPLPGGAHRTPEERHRLGPRRLRLW